MNLLSRYMNRPGFDQRLSANVFRLLDYTVAQMDTNYYVELGELALSAGFPTEAKKVVDAGFANGALGTGPEAAVHKKLRDRANKGAADDAKSIAAGEAKAKANKDGIGLVNHGYALVTMEQYDKGIELMKQGIEKGMKRPEDGRLLLGIAYAKAGKKDDAIKTFESVGGDKNTKDLAHYWISAVKNKGAAPAQ
jgi:tetratricopeptide (TPR) repeat protein